MTDETVQVQPVAQETAVPEQAEVTNEADAQASTDESTKPERKPDRKATRAERRIGELTYRAKQAERELAELRAWKQQQENSAPKAAKPKAEDFQTNDEFVEAMARHKAEEILAEREKKQSEARQKDQSAESYQKAKADWEKKEAAFVKEHEDYDEVIEEFSQLIPKDQNSAQIVNQILSHEHGPAILYALANDLDLAEQVFSKPHTFAARKLNSIAADLQKPPEPKKLPNPPTPVKGGSSGGELSGRELRKRAGLI